MLFRITFSLIFIAFLPLYNESTFNASRTCDNSPFTTYCAIILFLKFIFLVEFLFFGPLSPPPPDFRGFIILPALLWRWFDFSFCWHLRWLFFFSLPNPRGLWLLFAKDGEFFYYDDDEFDEMEDTVHILEVGTSLVKRNSFMPCPARLARAFSIH